MTVVSVCWRCLDIAAAEINIYCAGGVPVVFIWAVAIRLTPIEFAGLANR